MLSHLSEVNLPVCGGESDYPYYVFDEFGGFVLCFRCGCRLIYPVCGREMMYCWNCDLRFYRGFVDGDELVVKG